MLRGESDRHMQIAARLRPLFPMHFLAAAGIFPRWEAPFFPVSSCFKKFRGFDEIIDYWFLIIKLFLALCLPFFFSLLLVKDPI